MRRHTSIIGGVLALATWLLAVPAPSQAQQQPAAVPGADEAVHNELRAIKERALKAVNERDEEALAKELSPSVQFTAMNNERVSGVDGARAYYKKMLVGAGAIVREMKLTAKADDLTTLYNGGNTGIVTGTSDAMFKLATGLEFTVPLRWTATLVRDSGKWSIAGLHYSANMFDNPLLSAAGKGSRWAAMLGIPLALLLGLFFGRRRSRKA